MKIEEIVNLKRLTSVVRKNSLKIILILFLFTLCGCFYTYNMVEPKYKSTSTILLASDNLKDNSNDSLTQSEITLNTSLISTYGEILKSNKVLDQVINNLSMNISREELDKSIEIEEIEDTQILQISVINQSASGAQEIAQELNKVFIQEIKQIYNINNVNIMDQATLEEEPYNVNHIKDILIFFALGAIISISMIGIIFIFDTTIKVEQDIEEYTGLNVIGVVPTHKEKEQELVAQNNSKSIVSESLRTIRTNLSFSNIEESKSILFTSCNPGEGKSWITSNMAVTYAQANKNVIIVDADMRRGRQHEIFNVQNFNGLSDCLRVIKNEQNFQVLKKYIKETKIPKLHIITIGTVPPNPSELLLSERMKDLIYMLKCIYDVVIIDGTPCNLVSDSIPVSRLVDTTILVTESRKTKIEDVKNTIKSIKNAEGKISGAILNKKEIENKIYGNGYYYGNTNNNLNSQIEVKDCTVEELIENRKTYPKNNKIEIIEKNADLGIENLSQKMDEFSTQLLKITDMNLDNYHKILDKIKENYTNEIDKNKLAEEIKTNITNNELIKLLDYKLSETKDIIEEKIENSINKDVISNILANEVEKINYNNEETEKFDYDIKMQEIFNKVNDIDSKINMNLLEGNIQEMILESQKEQNMKLQNINNNEYLQEILEAINKVKQEQNERLEKLEKIDNREIFTNLTTEIEKLNKKYEKIEDIEKKIESGKIEESLTQLIEEIQQKNTDKEETEKFNFDIEIQEIINKVNDIDSKINMNSLEENIQEMILESQKEQNIKLQNIKNNEYWQEILEAINKVKQEQNERLEKLEKIDNSEIFSNLTTEIEKLNKKYEKIEDIEKKIESGKIEENITQLIEEIQQRNTNKLEQFNNTDQLKEILQELKDINMKYEKLQKQLLETNISTQNFEYNNKNILSSKENTLPRSKNKIIEITDLKRKANKEELIIKYGEGIAYEELLDFAIDVYEINKKQNKAI